MYSLTAVWWIWSWWHNVTIHVQSRYRANRDHQQYSSSLVVNSGTTEFVIFTCRTFSSSLSFGDNLLFKLWFSLIHVLRCLWAGLYPVQETSWWFLIWPPERVSIVDGSYWCRPPCFKPSVGLVHSSSLYMYIYHSDRRGLFLLNSLAPGRFQRNFMKVIFQLILVKLYSNECQWTLLMVNQHWFR